METVRQAVLECMRNCTPDDDLISSLNAVIEQEGKWACKIIMKLVAHRDCDIQDSARHWGKILAHHAELSQVLARSVSLQVAVCDYFHWIDKSISYPMLIDVHKFEEISKQARRDFLTGLYNRQEFDEAIKREVARAKRYERKLSLVFVDLDSLKKLNYQYGHLAGDKALQRLSQFISKNKRLEDIISRYGGDEFVILLPDTGKEEALSLTERFRKMVEHRNISYDGHSLQITISGGVATFPEDAQNSIKLIQCADHALHVAKREGKNVVLAYKKEARKFVRLPFYEKIKGTTLSGKENTSLSAESKNLGYGGMLLENKFSIHVGSVVEICIVFGGETVTLRGEVVRTEPLTEDRFNIGVSFMEKEESAKIFLENYMLNSLMQNSNFMQGTNNTCQ